MCDSRRSILLRASTKKYAITYSPENSSGFKIFNGREAGEGDYPWTGWVLTGTRKVKCGAVLIADKYALTAASCVDEEISTVWFGDHSRSTDEDRSCESDLQCYGETFSSHLSVKFVCVHSGYSRFTDEGTEQMATVKSVTQHPDYSSDTFECDIAVIEFVDELSTRRSDAVEAIQMLPEDKLTDRIMDKHCRGCGWGFEISGASERARDQSDVLLEIVVDVNDTCTESPMGTVCYNPFRDPDSLTCAGDVGGPFMCKRRGVWTLVGVISGWNIDSGCVPGNRAATLVTDVLTWIDSIINVSTQSLNLGDN